jgi:hypothetical protein
VVRPLLLLVVVSHVGEPLSARIRPVKRDHARLPVFRHSNGARHHPSASFFSADLHLDLCVVHARIHVRHVVNAAIAAMEDPGPAMIGDLELLVGDAGLLVAIATIRANESHVFVVDDRDADVELIDPVDNELDIWPSHVGKLDSLPDLHVEAVSLLSGSRAGKQHADDDRQEYLLHFLGVAEQETRRSVKTRGRDEAFSSGV